MSIVQKILGLLVICLSRAQTMLLLSFFLYTNVKAKNEETCNLSFVVCNRMRRNSFLSLQNFGKMRVKLFPDSTCVDLIFHYH